MRAIKIGVLYLLCFALIACTPEYTRQTGNQLATGLRLTDSIAVRRGNLRLLSRQATICLASDATNTEAGLEVLHTMQAAFNGHFLAVSIQQEPMDYLRALSGASCPNATYLFYVTPYGNPVCADNSNPCTHVVYSQLVITIIRTVDNLLQDRIEFSMKRGLFHGDKADQQRQAFEQLANDLAGID